MIINQEITLNVEDLNNFVMSLCKQHLSPNTTGKEEKEEKPIAWSMYYTYLSAGADVFTIGMVAILFIATQGSYIFSDWWLSYW